MESKTDKALMFVEKMYGPDDPERELAAEVRRLRGIEAAENKVINAYAHGNGSVFENLDKLQAALASGGGK